MVSVPSIMTKETIWEDKHQNLGQQLPQWHPR